MSPRRLKIEVVAASGLILLLLAAAAAAQGDPGQESVRRAVEKGRKLLKDWKIEEARSQFEQARIASNDQAAAPFVGLAEVELKLDDLEVALQYVDKALERTHDPTSRAEILNLKGIIFFGYVRRSFPKDAVTSAKPPRVGGSEGIPTEEHELDPAEAGAARVKRFWQERQERAAVAETYFREALEVSSGSLNAARLNLAEALQRQGKLEESRQLVDEYVSRAGKGDDPAAARDLMCWLDLPRSSTPSAGDTKPGKITPPERKRAPDPQYTPWARKKRTQGSVVVEMVIDEKGDVACLRVVRGLPDGLSEATAKTLKKWKYKPAIVDGKPVRVYHTATATFSLGG